MTPAQALQVLAMVDAGLLTTTPEDRQACADGYTGHFWFTLSNGWRVCVFNDCEEWDYIHAIQAPGEPEVEIPFQAWLCDTDAWEPVREWKPSGYDAAMRAWGIAE